MRQNKSYALVVVAALLSVAASAAMAQAVPPTPAAPAAAPAAVPAAPSASSITISPDVAPETQEQVYDENDHREKLKEMLFDMHKKDAWLTLTEEERKGILKETLPSMTFNSLDKDKLDEASDQVDQCVDGELQKEEYANFDVATAMTACLFKLGYAR